MNIGFLSSPADERCPISQLTLRKYEKDGFKVATEKDIGKALGDSFGEHDMARDAVLANADIICCVSPPSSADYDQAKSDAIFISFYQPYVPGFDQSQFDGKSAQIFSLDMIPRSTLAQSMDALSAMASLAGYKAVLLAAEKLPRLFPMMMTASGAIRPANVLVIGAGVAGLQAIATARRLGARVEAFDVRSAVREEVQSLGAKFVEVEGAKEDAAAGGYAVEQTDEFKQKQKEAIANSVKKADVVITTAQIRGRVAPILVTRAMVEAMLPGSVIIDLASSTGGNCEVTQDQAEIFHHNVRVIGNSELYLDALQDASDLLSNIIYNYIKLFVKEGQVAVDLENPILSSSLIYPTQ
jgi:NAD(P) transhydrogenase subunit alpha